jgi:Flp pilus assembly protein CpaB
LKRTNRLVLLIGIFLAVVAFVLIILLLQDGGPGPSGNGGPTPPPDLPTVIATQDIDIGVTVTESMLTTEVMPQAQRVSGVFQDPSQVIGKVVRQAITSGAQVSSANFADCITDCPLAVPAGLRAMAIQIDAVSGVGTIIQTGDHVDMVLGLAGDAFPVVQLAPEDQTITVVAGLNNTSVKVLIEGMQVLRVVRQAPPPPAEGQAPTPTPTAGAPSVSEESTALVILGVTAQQAELVKFAQMQGSISLALRSSQDFFDENGEPLLPLPAGTTGVILKGLIDNYGVLTPELVEAILPEQEAQ